MERMLNTTKPWVSCPALYKLGVVAHVYNPGMREMGSQKLKTSRKVPNKTKTQRQNSTLFTIPQEPCEEDPIIPWYR